MNLYDTRINVDNCKHANMRPYKLLKKKKKKKGNFLTRMQLTKLRSRRKVITVVRFENK